MSRAVVLGEKRNITAFKGVGIDALPVEDGQKLFQSLMELSRERELGIVLVTENLAEQAPEAIEEFRRRSAAVLCIIPTHEGSRRTSFQAISRLVESSLGIDILGKD
ncbi:MAG TPA: V-type ATP synthase subunit F [Deltaproteobacteria bacterium]|mgnify:CR=1 FL=1|nr:V-type ATP synthase subunit F [Deltaproteobacteria bacterium]HPR56277.1 V-type ATP synthase subunit F [Deltaproteobacteria bacterium]HXK46489.1 V-type ATP synthase subunit F [Deltaproteobacteria bacterium]